MSRTSRHSTDNAKDVESGLISLQHYKYEHLNLTVDQYGRYDPAHVTKYHQPIGSLWMDKLEELVIYLQTSALLMIMSTWWPWPDKYYENGRFIYLFNLDIPAYLTADGSTISFQLLYYAGFGLAVTIILIGLLVFRSKARVAYHQTLCGIRAVHIERSILTFCEMLYIPVALTAARAITCSGSKLMLMDSTESCYTMMHFIVLLCILFPLIYVVFAFPIRMWRHTRQHAVFAQQHLHEKYLCSKEIEFLMGVNDTFGEDQLYILSSYRRKYSQMRAIRCIYRLALVAIVVFVGQHWVSDGIKVQQTVVFVSVVAVNRIYKMLEAVYRVPSTGMQIAVLECTLLSCSILGMFSATETRSAFFVDSTLYTILFIVNGTGVALFALLVLVDKVRKVHWPVTQADIVKLLERDMDIVNTINASKRVLEFAFACPTEFVKREDLERQMMALDAHRRHAHETSHILAWTLQDMTEDLALEYDRLDNESFVPDAPFESMLEGLRPRLTQRTKTLALMLPDKKELLEKLSTVAVVMGDNFVQGDRSEFVLAEDVASPRTSLMPDFSAMGVGSDAGSGVGSMRSKRSGSGVDSPNMAILRRRSMYARRGSLQVGAEASAMANAMAMARAAAAFATSGGGVDSDSDSNSDLDSQSSQESVLSRRSEVYSDAASEAYSDAPSD
jgi:hypothetical protein